MPWPAVRRGQFDLALIDLGLPDGNGIDVVGALRASSRRPSRWWSRFMTTTSTCSRRCRPAPSATC
jgi:DNA-binding response OmpR family regulator